MSTWKRVLTTSDVTNDNLGSTDLAPTAAAGNSFIRKFTLPSEPDSSALLFEGYIKYDGYNTQKRPMLRIETETDSDSTAQNYVYAASLRIGSISSVQAIDGDASGSGYSLPQFKEDHEGNKIMVSSANWTASSGAVNFMNLEDLVGVSSPQTSSTVASGDVPSTLAATDTLLMYDASLANTNVRHVAACGIRSFFVNTARDQDLSHGTWYMKGPDGVLLNASNGHGIVIPYDCYLTTISGGFEKETGTSQRRRVSIYVNGSLTHRTTSYFGATNALGSYVSFATNAFTKTSNSSATSNISLSAGDVVTFAFYSPSSYTGTGSLFQINAMFSTVPYL